MNEQQLLSLLQRYMDGLTTVDEESALAVFFGRASDADRPDAISAEDWKVYQEMFAMFAPQAQSLTQKHKATEREVIEHEAIELEATEHRSRFTLRQVSVWIASAAAVALIVFAASTQLRHDSSSSPTLAQHSVSTPAADSLSDSISADQPQRIVVDSVRQKLPKQKTRKAPRPYWQPRPPKVYMAGANKPSTAQLDSAKIEEAVRQADILLQTINAQQSVEMDKLQLQALELMEDEDYDNDMAQ